MSLKESLRAFTPVGNNELEVRFKLNDTNNNKQRLIFYPLNDILKAEFPYVDCFHVDYITGGERYSNIGDKIYKTTKTSINNSFINDQVLQTKIALASEENLLMNDETFKRNLARANTKRVKNRTTFLAPNAKIDITIVQTSKITNQDQYKTYEIEVEYENDDRIDDNIAFDNYVKIVDKIRGYIYELNVILEVNTWALGNPRCDRLLTFVPKPRDLKRADCVYGGLLPLRKSEILPYKTKSEEIETNYAERIDPEEEFTITVKSDGMRMLVIVNSTGIWSMGIKSNSKPKKLHGNMANMRMWIGSIFDCEFINGKYHIFDILTFQSRHNVQRFPHIAYNKDFTNRIDKDVENRILYCKSFLKCCKDNSFEEFDVKKFFLLGNDHESLSDALYKALDYQDNYEYRTDGFIITPINHNMHLYKDVSKVPLKNRVLSKYLDICKLKPRDMLSIDFLVKEGKLYSYGTKGELIEFDGSRYNAGVKYVLEGDVEVVDGTITEFSPLIVENEFKYLYPTRQRHDRDAPNSIIVAQSIWDLIFTEFGIDSLLGKNFILVRAEHNRVKNEILSEIPKNAFVIDIGSGRGGDLDKLLNVSGYLGIEPNESNIEEFNRRLNNHRLKYIAKAINAKGEDTEFIVSEAKKLFDELNLPPGTPVYVISMLSLSFFWESKEILDKFKNTLRAIRNSIGLEEFMFLTIEKKRLLKALNGKKSISYGPVSFKVDGNKVLVDFPNTIVGLQEEYLVDLDQLNDLGAVEEYDMPLEKYILSDSEIKYNSMYVKGSVILID